MEIMQCYFLEMNFSSRRWSVWLVNLFQQSTLFDDSNNEDFHIYGNKQQQKNHSGGGQF